MARVLRLALFVGLLLRQPVDAQGILSQSRTGKPAPSAPPAAAPPNTQNPRLEQEDKTWIPGGDGQALLYVLIAAGAVAVVVGTSPLWVPPCVMNDSPTIRGYFPAHPYALDYSNFLHCDPHNTGVPEDRDTTFGDRDHLKGWSTRLWFEEGNDCRGLNRVGGGFLLDTYWRGGVQTSWNYYSEKLDNGHTDDTVLGNAHLTYRWAQCDWGQVHMGLGARMQTDRHDTRAGFSFLYSADFFPHDPLVISTLVDLGNLSDNFAIHARGTVGVQLLWMELFAGYDFYRVDGVNLQGPLAGLRLSY